MNIAIAAREPIATRELRQAGRQRRGPILLGGLSIAATLIGLLVTSVMTSDWSTPTEIGPAVFEGLFALATFVVVIVGATVAASSVASEREGHTWEALLLSGLRPSAIARGKFLSAFGQAALYLLALTPSAGLSFLVGGVTVTEIVVAFTMLLAVAALAVVFGLAVSSYARTARGALAGALIATLVVGPGIYSLFIGLGALTGEGLGTHEGRGATWLAHAISAAPFDERFFVFFVLNPILALVVPGWLIFEVTKANLSDASDDRSTGLRRWYAVATLLVVLGAVATLGAVTPSTTERDVLTVALLCVVAAHLGVSVMVFGGEPLGPSRRVLARWARLPASGLTTLARRILGPGIAAATALHTCLGTFALGAVLAIGLALSNRHEDCIVMCGSYAIGFHLFVTGLTGALAVRLQRPTIVRGIIVAATLVLSVVPLVAGSLGRAMSVSSFDERWRIVDSFSPFFTMVAGANPSSTAIGYAQASAVGYGLIGLFLVLVTFLGARRAMPSPVRAV